MQRTSSMQKRCCTHSGTSRRACSVAASPSGCHLLQASRCSTSLWYSEHEVLPGISTSSMASAAVCRQRDDEEEQ